MKRFATLALGVALMAPLGVSAQMYQGGPGMYHGMRHKVGRIASVGGGSFTFDDGQTVFLHHGTVINPTGRPLHPGQRVDVRGSGAGNGAINANVVNILPRF